MLRILRRIHRGLVKTNILGLDGNPIASGIIAKGVINYWFINKCNNVFHYK